MHIICEYVKEESGEGAVGHPRQSAPTRAIGIAPRGTRWTTDASGWLAGSGLGAWRRWTAPVPPLPR